MTTWIKKLRLYFLRRQVKSVSRRLIEMNAGKHPLAWWACFDQRVELVGRIAEIEKTL